MKRIDAVKLVAAFDALAGAISNAETYGYHAAEAMNFNNLNPEVAEEDSYYFARKAFGFAALALEALEQVKG